MFQKIHPQLRIRQIGQKIFLPPLAYKIIFPHRKKTQPGQCQKRAKPFPHSAAQRSVLPGHQACHRFGRIQGQNHISFSEKIKLNGLKFIQGAEKTAAFRTGKQEHPFMPVSSSGIQLRHTGSYQSQRALLFKIKSLSLPQADGFFQYHKTSPPFPDSAS